MDTNYVIYDRFMVYSGPATFINSGDFFTVYMTLKRYEQHRKCEDWRKDVLNCDEENIKDDFQTPYKTNDTPQRSKDTELYDDLSKTLGILKMMDNSVKCSCARLAEPVRKGNIGWTQLKDDRELPTNVDHPLKEENSSAEANESEKRSRSKSSHGTRRKYVHVSHAKLDDHPSTSSAGRSAHLNNMCSSVSLRRMRGLLKGWSTYGYYLLIICLLMNPRMSHSYMYNYQPNIECPKDFVAHGNTCCGYIECDPGFQVRTCSSNFTADTCEVCPPGTMSYDPTNSKFVYPCIGVKEECPIGPSALLLLKWIHEHVANDVNVTQQQTTVGRIHADVGKESRSTDMTTTGTSNDESTWVHETEMNKTTIFDLMNQTTSSTSILLSTLHSKNELSPPIATKAAKTNITTTKPTKTPQPPVMYDKQYIYDVLSIHNPKFKYCLSRIYPSELEVKETTETNNSAFYWDIMMSYETDGHMNTSLYDKSDNHNFSITNVSFLSSSFPSSPAYGVFISQLIRYPEQVPNRQF
ncbi:hypothetical protein FSP39_006616 [Pinctada imbricata]|uniref:Uncharacterized protein n=1 Tax=Pinctada imbricata TaxID=66713 RepID=A0AA88YL80_PINIB|nr:hypothetical protein FSP39_006616 [Pinctada imbricata]